MNIAVLEGSPNKRSSSNLLAEHFIRSVQEAGHTVGAIGAAHAGLRPCTGCVRCSYEGSCTQKGAMGVSRRQIPAADMLVSVTPLYYYGMPAQLKPLADRFCAINSSTARRHMKPVPIAAWNADGWTFDAPAAHCQRWCDGQGMLLGTGHGTMASRGKYLDKAYRPGRGLWAGT